MSNSNKKIIILPHPTYDEHLEDLVEDCILKGDKEACRWFNYYFYSEI